MARSKNEFDANYIVLMAGKIVGFKSTASGARVMARRLAIANPNRTIVVFGDKTKYNANVNELVATG